MSAVYHSEHGQDKWLNDHIFHNRQNGIFVEFGAIDGMMFSNTRYFEMMLGWTGILIEADPVNFAALLASPRKAHKVLAAVEACYGLAKFERVPSVHGWGGLSATMEGQHKERIAEHGGSVGFFVPMVPLNDILAKCGITKIDYMSVDVEGAEYMALCNFDFDKYPTEIFEVENNYGRKDVEALMTSKGYEKIAQIQINDIFRRAQ
jgi:FkbM family methyltransferase